jgi:acetylornithine deacetylase/succinyl-diaminopimelate desuccinylase family protein
LRTTGAGMSTDGSSGVGTAVLAAIDDRETLNLLRALIRVPSENPPGSEEAIARILASYFEDNGVPARLREVRPGRPNVVAEVGSPDGPTLVFNGHLDTVPVGEGWTVDPFGGEVCDGRVYGRGACDMLGGVAAMCAAAVALRRSDLPLNGRLVVHGVVDEEVDAIGSQLAADEVEANWVVVTEPTGGNVYAFGKGQVNVEVTFKGRAAHSSVPDAGHNAIHDAAAFVMLVEQEHRRLTTAAEAHVGPPTFSTGVIRGGMTGSIVPADCTVVVDRRVLPLETLEDGLAHLKQLLDRLRESRPGVDATIRPTLLFPPFPPSNDDSLARAVQAVIRELDAGSGEITGFAAATDAAWYARRGFATVIYGPGDGATAHKPDEWVAVDDVHAGTQVLALVAARLLAGIADHAR